MNVSTNTNSPFPDQVVSDAEKATLEYGLASFSELLNRSGLITAVVVLIDMLLIGITFIT